MTRQQFLTAAILCCALSVNLPAAKKQKTTILPYQNAALSIDERVKDLIERMTWEEKIGQMRCTMAWNYYDITTPATHKKAKNKAIAVAEAFKKDLAQGHIGMLWATYRADPWTQKSLENGLTPELAAKTSNALQRYNAENTRLGIPLFLAEEAPHGHMAIGTTTFPTGLGMAATWSPELIERVGHVIGKEIRLQGGHISYGPVLDLSRDPRWSRVEETYGEDPILTAELGAAMVRGLGGGDLTKPYSTVATLKHFIAYGATEGGLNGSQTVLGPIELHQNFLPPFRKAIEAGALSVMTSYNSCDGIPSTSNHHLLTNVLRQQWGFRGFVVSDLFSIDGIAGMGVARDKLDAAIMAMQAGVDADLGANAYGKVQSLRSQEAQEPRSKDNAIFNPIPHGTRLAPFTSHLLDSLINSSCERILRLKFEMGLFDNPYVDPKAAAANVRTEADRQVALDVARASITLLKNNGILPLRVDEKSGIKDEKFNILVVGPNADSQYNQLGDYTAPQADGNVTTVLEGIRTKQISIDNSQLTISYVKGCAVRDTTENSIAQAVSAARDANVVIAVVGGSSARDFKTSYKETGAAEANDNSHSTSFPQIPDMDSGEGFDRATLDLMGLQPRLLDALKKTGKPLVVVYIEGRPLDKTWAAEHADALLTAYYPGQEGGTAIADVLFGDYNPAGRLPISVPRSTGQLPVYYNKRAPRAHDYVEMTSKSLYPFGYGLSYTTFEYSDLTIIKTTSTDEPSAPKTDSTCKTTAVSHASPVSPKASAAALPVFTVSCSITNTGQLDGEEVVQLYLHDNVASVVQPLKQLKHFQRVFIPKGETRRVQFKLTPDDLAIIDQQLQTTVEPGEFTVLIGASSGDIRLHSQITVE